MRIFGRVRHYTSKRYLYLLDHWMVCFMIYFIPHVYHISQRVRSFQDFIPSRTTIDSVEFVIVGSNLDAAR